MALYDDLHAGSGGPHPSGDAKSDSAKKELDARAQGQHAVQQVSYHQAMQMFLDKMSTNTNASRGVRDEARLLRRVGQSSTMDRKKQDFFNRALNKGELQKSLQPDQLAFFELNLNRPDKLPENLRLRQQNGTLMASQGQLNGSAHTHETTEHAHTLAETAKNMAVGEAKNKMVHSLEEFAGAIIAPTILGG